MPAPSAGMTVQQAMPLVSPGGRRGCGRSLKILTDQRKQSPRFMCQIVSDGRRLRRERSDRTAFTGQGLRLVVGQLPERIGRAYHQDAALLRDDPPLLQAIETDGYPLTRRSDQV